VKPVAGAGCRHRRRNSPATMRSCSASGRACRVVPGQHRSKSRAIVMESTSATACSTTTPSPSQIRKPSASCSASGWRQSTFTTRSSPSRVTGATHAVPPGLERLSDADGPIRLQIPDRGGQPREPALSLCTLGCGSQLQGHRQLVTVVAHHRPACSNRPPPEMSTRSVDLIRVGAPCYGAPRTARGRISAVVATRKWPPGRPLEPARVSCHGVSADSVWLGAVGGRGVSSPSRVGRAGR